MKHFGLASHLVTLCGKLSDTLRKAGWHFAASWVTLCGKLGDTLPQTLKSLYFSNTCAKYAPRKLSHTLWQTLKSLYFSNTCAKYAPCGFEFVVFLEHFCAVAAVLLISMRSSITWSGSLASFLVILFKIQKNDFLHWSNVFLMILSLRELQFLVWLINFHVFSLLKSIF